MARKIGKQQAKFIRYHNLLREFNDAFKKCIDKGIHISPECVVDRTRWRIVIEFKDSRGGIKERKESDPVFYYSKEDYEIKVMEITIFYADKG